MELGAFSISLAVKDIAASRTFYEKLGFTAIGGDGDHWQIMQNGEHVIGLFQGMFERNILTFSPGWDQHQQPLSAFADVRQLAEMLQKDGVVTTQETNLEKSEGPASFVVVDPDGNPILIDQHR